MCSIAHVINRFVPAGSVNKAKSTGRLPESEETVGNERSD
jgi:hypothetical protein